MGCKAPHVPLHFGARGESTPAGRLSASTASKKFPSEKDGHGGRDRDAPVFALAPTMCVFLRAVLPIEVGYDTYKSGRAACSGTGNGISSDPLVRG